MPDKLTQTSQQKKDLDKAKRREQREDNDVKKLLTFVEFRRFIWRLLTLTGMYKTSFTGNSTTFFNEGLRSVGLKILAMIMRASPMSFAQMQQEFYSERTSEEAVKQKEDLEKEIFS